MCLYSKNYPRIAKRNIVCYKVLRKWLTTSSCSKYIDSETIVTPVTLDIVTVKTGGSFEAAGTELKQKTTSGYAYSRGFIHTFKNVSDALEFLEICKANSDSVLSFIIYYCIIPKNTKYVKGKDEHNYESYASKKIVFKEEIAI